MYAHELTIVHPRGWASGESASMQVYYSGVPVSSA